MTFIKIYLVVLKKKEYLCNTNIECVKINKILVELWYITKYFFLEKRLYECCNVYLSELILIDNYLTLSIKDSRKNLLTNLT